MQILPLCTKKLKNLLKETTDQWAFNPGNWHGLTANTEANAEANCYFTVLRQQNFSYAKYFFINSKGKANMDIYFYFLNTIYS